MQQAYQALRIVSEAQTIHIIQTTQPGELTLRELISVCAGLQASSDNGIKAVVLDFASPPAVPGEVAPVVSGLLTQAREAVSAISQPVLAVVRSRLSETAAQLAGEADFILIAHEASLFIPQRGSENMQGEEDKRVNGSAAVRLGYATWTASTGDLNRELVRILNMLRSKSAIALRHAKASVRLMRQQSIESLEALHRVNQFYLERVMQTEDAHEGLQAFLEKRQPHWKNR